MKTGIALLLCVGATMPTAVTNVAPPARVPSPIQFTAVEREAWGGKPLIAARSVQLTRSLPPRVHVPQSLRRPGARYGVLTLRDPEHPLLIGVEILPTANGGDRLYVDRAGSGRIDAVRSQVLRRDGIPWSVCRGAASSRITISVPAQAGAAPFHSRLAIWLGANPNLLYYSLDGYEAGKLSIDGRARSAFLVDGNADGIAGNDAQDQLWIDRNGDGKLDRAGEEFSVAPVVQIGLAPYTLAITGGLGGMQSVLLRRAGAGLGSIRVEYTAPAGETTGASATLVSRAGDVVNVGVLHHAAPVAAGVYHLSNLRLRITDSTRQTWSYVFCDWADPNETGSFSLRAPAGQPVVFKPAIHLNLDSQVEGDPKPGAALTVKLSARTDTGLSLMTTERSRAPENAEDYAHIRLIGANGATLSQASTGFR